MPPTPSALKGQAAAVGDGPADRAAPVAIYVGKEGVLAHLMVGARASCVPRAATARLRERLEMLVAEGATPHVQIGGRWAIPRERVPEVARLLNLPCPPLT